jgi:ATP-dependent Clp protease adaptor protein ClpS
MKEDKLHRQWKSNSDSGDSQHNLILYNDEVNDFGFVIESLVEVCNHDNLQAEQCAYLAHYRGRCEVKTGTYEELKTMKEALTARGIQAEVH